MEIQPTAATSATSDVNRAKSATPTDNSDSFSRLLAAAGTDTSSSMANTGTLSPALASNSLGTLLSLSQQPVQTVTSEASSTAESTSASSSASTSRQASSSPQDSGWNWTTVASGVSTATGPDGTKWTKYNLNEALTSSDKQILGWSDGDNNPITDTLAGLVAQDRYEGTLTGPITQDYIFGNQAKGIVGLAQRGPETKQATDLIDGMLDRLSA
jgi:hypothetical protein